LVTTNDNVPICEVNAGLKGGPWAGVVLVLVAALTFLLPSC
jgi:hypothetical protein